MQEQRSVPFRASDTENMGLNLAVDMEVRRCLCPL